MKPSDYMRAGRLLVQRQHYHNNFSFVHTQQGSRVPEAACAFGCMYLGISGLGRFVTWPEGYPTRQEVEISDSLAKYKMTLQDVATVAEVALRHGLSDPTGVLEARENDFDLGLMIVILNDQARWTVEAIADALEALGY